MIAGLFSLIPLVGATIAAVLIGHRHGVRGLPDRHDHLGDLGDRLPAVREPRDPAADPEAHRERAPVHHDRGRAVRRARCSACWARSWRSRSRPRSRSCCASTWTCARCRIKSAARSRPAAHRPPADRRRTPPPRSLQPHVGVAHSPAAGCCSRSRRCRSTCSRPRCSRCSAPSTSSTRSTRSGSSRWSLLQAGSFACMWGVQRLAVRAERWGPVITSQLAVERVRARRAGRRGRLGRDAVRDARARRRAGRRGGVGHDRVVAARVRHAARAAAARAARGARRGRRSTPASTGRRWPARVVFVLHVSPLGAACVLWDRPLRRWSGRAAQAVAQPGPAQARAAHRPARAAAARARRGRATCSAATGGRRCCSRPAAGCSTT